MEETQLDTTLHDTYSARQRLYAYERVEKHRNNFVAQVSTSLPPQADEFLGVLVRGHEDGCIDVVTLGTRAVGIPETTWDEGKWTVTYGFHLLKRTAVGDPTSELVYSVRITSSGMLNFPGIGQFDLTGDSMTYREGTIVNAFKGTLLVAIERALMKRE